MKCVGNFQGLEINFGKLLRVYLMVPPDLEALGAMRPLEALGQFALLSPLLAVLTITMYTTALSKIIAWCIESMTEIQSLNGKF